jgi:hypothetical protein
MIATSLQIIGAVLASIGLGIIWIPLGVITLGVFSVLFGIALERDNA